MLKFTNKIIVIFVSLFLILISVPTTTFSHTREWGTSGIYGLEYTAYTGLMPAIEWTRGCAPTSAAMVISYWDAYNITDCIGGFGRLVSYWQDLKPHADNTTLELENNVPDILDSLRIAMGTDSSGSTLLNNIGPGMISVTNSLKGYNFSTSHCEGSSQNDSCWDWITNEIYYARPFVWSVGDPSSLFGLSGHSLAAWGYTDTKYVMVYNTWTYATDYWYYKKYNNGSYSNRQEVDTLIPGGAENINVNLLLYSPGGTGNNDDATSNERYHAGQSIPIQWYQWGSDIVTISLLLSTDGGKTFNQIIARNLSSISGWNSYQWTIPQVSNSTVRIRIMGLNSSGQLIASDGSKYDFSIFPPF